MTEHCPAELRFVAEGGEVSSAEWEAPYAGLAQAIINPRIHAAHVTLLRRRKPAAGETAGYLETLRKKLLAEGPAALDTRQQFALLWDADSLNWLHREFWSRPKDQLHPWWHSQSGILATGKTGLVGD